MAGPSGGIYPAIDPPLGRGVEIASPRWGGKTLVLGPYPMGPSTHPMPMILLSGSPLLTHHKQRILPRKPSATSKNGPWNGVSQLTLQHMNAPSSAWTSPSFASNFSSLWLTLLFHLTSPSGSLVWPLTELSPLAHMVIPFKQSSFLAARRSVPWSLPRGILPSVQSFHLFRSFIWLTGVVPLPLR